MSCDCDQAVASVAQGQFGVFHLRQALQNGCSERMLRRRVFSGRWERLYPRVFRIRGTPPSRAQDLVAAFLWVEGGAVFSHRTAAEVHGFGFPRQESIEMITLRHLRVKDERVRLHRTRSLRARDVVAVGSLRVTSVDLTLMDLAGQVTDTALERCIDDVLRRGLCSLPGYDGASSNRAAPVEEAPPGSGRPWGRGRRTTGQPTASSKMRSSACAGAMGFPSRVVRWRSPAWAGSTSTTTTLAS